MPDEFDPQPFHYGYFGPLWVGPIWDAWPNIDRNEVPVSREYTQAQLLREKSVLLRSRQANRQRGHYDFKVPEEL